MVLKKHVRVVYFKSVGNGKGFEAFRDFGVTVVKDNGDLVINGPWSKVLDVRVVCAGTNDRRPCTCFSERVHIESRVSEAGLTWSEVECHDCILRNCKVLNGSGEL